MPVYGDPDGQIAQGDLFNGLGLAKRTLSGAWEPLGVDLGLVVAHDCDYTKFKTMKDRAKARALPFSVAPTYEASFLDGGSVGMAMKGAMVRFFPIHSEGDAPDLVADLWSLQPVPAGALAEAPRVARLSGEYVERLRYHLIWRFTRLELPRGDA